MKIKLLSSIVLLAAFVSCVPKTEKSASNISPEIDYSVYDGKFNVYFANDLGRNGYYDQKPIAELMGVMGEEVGPEFIVATGDVHHFDGVTSTEDPLWNSNYENIYAHPELMIDWYPVLGNHEYRGNTKAVIDYSAKSRRWEMPNRYYAKSFSDKGTTLKMVFIDTTPLIDKYQKESHNYPDVKLQDVNKQLAWLDSTLNASNEDWIIVAGHHPMYAQTKKSESERTDMQARVDTILRKYNVDMYIAGHIHNFQHFRVPGSNIDYVVNSSGSLARPVKAIENTVFCSPEPGFSIVSLDDKEMNLRMVDKTGKTLHTINRKKQ